MPSALPRVEGQKKSKWDYGRIARAIRTNGAGAPGDRCWARDHPERPPSKDPQSCATFLAKVGNLGGARTAGFRRSVTFQGGYRLRPETS